MQKINLYLGMTAVGVVLLPQSLVAQCVSPIQDCYTLGYTQNSCPNGKGVKCPFGNGWYCGGTAAQDCIKLGYDKDCTGAVESGNGETCNGKYQSCTCDSSYQYTCSGTGYAGGIGAACGGKYTQCNCASGYDWKDGGCKQQIVNGPDGEVYKCNGVVVGVRAMNMNFYVAMEDLGYQYWADANNKCSKYVFCNNIKGRLPSKDELITLYNNKLTVNNLLAEYGGTNVAEGKYWSSTNYGDIMNMSFYSVDMYNGKENGEAYQKFNYFRSILAL